MGADKILRIACVFSFPFDHVENDISRCVVRRFTKQIEFTSDSRELGAILEEKLGEHELGIKGNFEKFFFFENLKKKFFFENFEKSLKNF